MSENLIMGLGAAMDWSESKSKAIKTDIGNHKGKKYQVIESHLCREEEVFDGCECEWIQSGITMEMIHANWQEWQEPREYVSFDKAQEMISIACGLQHSNFPDKERIWSGSSDGTIWDMPVHQAAGEVFKVKAIPVEYLSPEWYVVFGVPTSAASRPRKRSTDESPTSICPNCEGLGIWFTDHFECQNEFCMDEWSLTNSDGFGIPYPKVPPEPIYNKDDNIIGCGADISPDELVFDLMYEEAREAADLGSRVASTSFAENFYWVREHGLWMTTRRDMVSLQTVHSQIDKKWRIIK